MPDQLQLRGGTTTEHNSFTGALREVTVDTTKKTLVVHDGSQAGGTPLMKESGATAASSVQIGTGGVERFKITSSEVVFNETSTDTDFRIEGNGNANLFKVDAGNDRIGIGVASPVSDIHTVSSSDHIITHQSTTSGADIRMNFRDSGNTDRGGIHYLFNGNSLKFITDQSEKMRVTGSGDVGIGTTSPTSLLHVNSGTTNTCATFQSTDSGAVINLTDNSARSSIEQNGTDLKIISDTDAGDADSTIKFLVDNSTKMTLDSSGRVGINETALSSFNSIGDDLVISQASGSAGITIRSGSSSTGVLAFTDGANTNFRGDLRYDHNGDYMRFSTDGSERLRINSSGNVGIGVTSIQEKLHVANAGNCNITSQCTASGSGANAAVQVKSADGGDYLIQTGNAVSGGLRVYDGGASAERVRIDSTGRVGIGTASPDVKLTVATSSGDAFIRATGGTNQGLLLNKSDGTLIGAFCSGGASGATVNDVSLRAETGNNITFAHGTTEKARITGDSSPTLLIGQTSAGADANGWTLRGAIQTSSVRFTSTDVRTMFFMSSYHSTGSSDTKFAFHSNGTLNATNTTIQAFSSERRTKKNIVALNLEKAWNTLRDTPFYTFNYKNEIEGTRLHHGPIVDECPEDLIVPTEKEDEVGIINTVNTEKLQYRAYSALQQALKRIEILESKIVALEAA